MKVEFPDTFPIIELVKVCNQAGFALRYRSDGTVAVVRGKQPETLKTLKETEK